MEKIKPLVPVLILTCLVFLLTGCYRQTTIILPQGQTLPSGADVSAETAVHASSDETTVPSGAQAGPQDPNGQSEEATSSHGKPPRPQPPAEAEKPAGSTVPAETTAPVETTMPAEIAVPVETNGPADTAVPKETATPAQATVSAETTTPTTVPLEHPVYDISNHRVGSYENSILEEINQRRADAAVSPLSLNKKLSALAAIRAYECTKDFSHIRPDGRSWDTVLSDYGASASTESLLYASSGTGASLLIDACMDSDSHRQKILNTGYSSIGIGIFDTGSSHCIVLIFR